MVGALLVVIAGVSLFAAHTSATRPARARFVVAARAIAPGQVLTTADVRTASMDLPDGTAAGSFTSSEQVVGHVALGPIGPGDLLDRTTVPDEAPTGRRAQLSLALDVDRTVDGSLRSGDRVDVLVTYGSGEGATTEVVTSRARLLAAPGAGDPRLGGERRQTVTLEVTDLDDALRLVHAARAGEVTLVRTTAFGGREYTSSTYAPAGDR